MNESLRMPVEDPSSIADMERCDYMSHSNYCSSGKCHCEHHEEKVYIMEDGHEDQGGYCHHGECYVDDFEICAWPSAKRKVWVD